jgi:hypothetical protein
VNVSLNSYMKVSCKSQVATRSHQEQVTGALYLQGQTDVAKTKVCTCWQNVKATKNAQTFAQKQAHLGTSMSSAMEAINLINRIPCISI